MLVGYKDKKKIMNSICNGTNFFDTDFSYDYESVNFIFKKRVSV